MKPSTHRGLAPFVLLALAALVASSMLRAADIPSNLKQASPQIDPDARAQQCLAVQDVGIPADDLAASNAQQNDDSCVPLFLYYDIKAHPRHSQGEWDSVHRCAVQQNEPVVLVTLYANGEFDKLMIAFRDFAYDRGAIETDSMGTGRAINEINSSVDEWNAFLKDLDTLDQNGKLPTYTPASAAEVDNRLNFIYRLIMSSDPVQEQTERLGDTTLTKADVRKTERAWLAYRDAWIRFCATTYPHVDPTTLVAILTARRAATLEDMRQEGGM